MLKCLRFEGLFLLILKLYYLISFLFSFVKKGKRERKISSFNPKISEDNTMEFSWIMWKPWACSQIHQVPSPSATDKRSGTLWPCHMNVWVYVPGSVHAYMHVNAHVSICGCVHACSRKNPPEKEMENYWHRQKLNIKTYHGKIYLQTETSYYKLLCSRSLCPQVLSSVLKNTVGP